MRAWLLAYAWRRARRLAERVGPLLPTPGRVLDVGSGTGHNAAVLRARGLAVVETDVANLHVVGPGPVPCQDGHLPFADDSFDAAILLYVLQYASERQALLREAARVARQVVIVQSTYRGPVGRAYLGAREYLTGRFAFRLARALRIVAQTSCPLDGPRLITRAALDDAVRRAGLWVAYAPRPSRRPVSRDLFVLERAT